MTDETLDGEVVGAFTAVVGESPPRGLDTTPADVGAWDSLTHVRLIFAIEQKLDVRLPETALVERTSLRQLRDVVRSAMKAR